MIASLGLLERFIGEGLVARYFRFWDRRTREKICEFDHEMLRDETPYPFVVQTEQHKLARMAVAALRAMPDSAAHFSTRVSNLEQRDDRVRVTALGPDGPRDFTADWVIGADGGRSSVRRMLGIEFVGYTWPERFMVVTTLLRIDAGAFSTEPFMHDHWEEVYLLQGDLIVGGDGAGQGGQSFAAPWRARARGPVGSSARDSSERRRTESPFHRQGGRAWRCRECLEFPDSPWPRPPPPPLRPLGAHQHGHHAVDRAAPRIDARDAGVGVRAAHDGQVEQPDHAVHSGVSRRSRSSARYTRR
jgi:hypothetical protein